MILLLTHYCPLLTVKLAQNTGAPPRRCCVFVGRRTHCTGAGLTPAAPSAGSISSAAGVSAATGTTRLTAVAAGTGGASAAGPSAAVARAVWPVLPSSKGAASTSRGPATSPVGRFLRHQGRGDFCRVDAALVVEECDIVRLNLSLTLCCDPKPYPNPDPILVFTLTLNPNPTPAET